MLTRLIVESYARLLEVALWLMLVLAGIGGYSLALPIMDAVGAEPAFAFAWKMVGAMVFSAVAFLLLAVFAGPLLILMDIRQSVRVIESMSIPREDGRPLPPLLDRREPSI